MRRGDSDVERIDRGLFGQGTLPDQLLRQPSCGLREREASAAGEPDGERWSGAGPCWAERS